MNLQIEPGETHEHGRCDCCGHVSRSITGFIYAGGAARATFVVHWTIGGVPTHGANFDFIIGTWGDGATSAGRYAVSLAFRRTESGPAFMVIDASTRPVAESSLVGEALSRAQVVGTEVATEAFALVDAVWLHDERIAEITGA